MARITVSDCAEPVTTRVEMAQMSFIQKRPGLLSIFASLPLAGGLAAGIVSSTASPAAAQSTVTISLTNSNSYCANITGGRNVSGTPIQLWKCSGEMTEVSGTTRE